MLASQCCMPSSHWRRGVLEEVKAIA